MNIVTNKWDEIIHKLKIEHGLSDVSFKTWISPLKFYEVKDHIVKIVIPSDQAQSVSYISSKYKSYFQVSISEMFNDIYEVVFVLEKDIKESDKSKEDSKETKKTVYNINHENANLNPKYIFDTFVVGGNNNFAHAASLAVAESPGEIYNPLFLYGGVGLGKTHLMHSIAHFILERDPSKKVLYVTSDQFKDDFIKAKDTTLGGKANLISLFKISICSLVKY